MTQGELADLTSVTRDAVARWEAVGTKSSREPSWSNVVALANALGVSTEAFRTGGAEAPGEGQNASEAGEGRNARPSVQDVTEGKPDGKEALPEPEKTRRGRKKGSG